MSRTPGRRRSHSSPADAPLPSPAASPGGTLQGPGSLGWLGRLELQHHALWAGARAGARCALAVGNPRCSTIALTPPAPFTYANTLKPASTLQAREHIQGERPAQQPGPVQTGCALGVQGESLQEGAPGLFSGREPHIHLRPAQPLLQGVRLVCLQRVLGPLRGQGPSFLQQAQHPVTRVWIRS